MYLKSQQEQQTRCKIHPTRGFKREITLKLEIYDLDL